MKQDRPTISTCYLVGNPVSHSISPLIHNTGFQYLELPFVYDAHALEENELEAFLATLDGTAIVGMNVTLPHKQAVMAYVDELSDTASAVGAVNVLYKRDGRLVGENTDVAGFLDPLQNANLEEPKVLILGSGGAARAVAYAASHHLSASSVVIAARNEAAARAISQATHYCTWNERHEAAQDADLVVNATPIGLYPQTKRSPLAEDHEWTTNQTYYDLIYNPDTTSAMKRALECGASVVGGLPMLIAQAAVAFKIWTDHEMPVDAVRKALRESL